MVQRYPSTGKPLEEERPPAPQPVQNAVKLMYVGAAVSTVSLIISLAFIGTVKSSLRTEFPKYTTSQINQAFTAFILVAIISAGIGIGLWLLMARASSQGKNWARITSSVLFVIETLTVLEAVRGPKRIIDLVFPVLTWLVGLGAIWFLWRPESTAFFKRKSYR
jgi:uncharacterized membrane protein YkvI